MGARQKHTHSIHILVYDHQSGHWRWDQIGCPETSVASYQSSLTFQKKNPNAIQFLRDQPLLSKWARAKNTHTHPHSIHILVYDHQSGHWRWDQIGSPETSVRNYHYSLRNNPEERSFHLLRRRKPEIKHVILCSLVGYRYSWRKWRPPYSE